MTDHLNKEQRSENMRLIHSQDTKPEISIRKALFQLGYRYRLHVKNLPGKPDIVLKKYHSVIDVRGCFWHGHNCHRGNIPKSNTEYWKKKINNNSERDNENEEHLNQRGWNVIKIWECQCSSSDNLKKSINKIDKKLKKISKKWN